MCRCVCSCHAGTWLNEESSVHCALCLVCDFVPLLLYGNIVSVQLILKVANHCMSLLVSCVNSVLCCVSIIFIFELNYSFANPI